MTTGVQGMKAFVGCGNFPYQIAEPFIKYFVYFSVYYLSKDSASVAKGICKSRVKIVFSLIAI